MMRLRNKGLDEFAFVLIGGILFIIIGLISWGIPQNNNTSQSNETNMTFPGAVEVVGVYTQDIPKTYWFGRFDVRYGVGSSILFERENLEARRSLFGGNDIRITFLVERDELENQVTSGFIDMYIEDSSMNGNLEVFLNGRKIREVRPTIGEVVFEFDKSFLRDQNVLELRAQSPGFKFWESTFYKLRYLKVGVYLYGRSDKSFDFELSKQQVENLYQGKLEFEREEWEGNGKLIIKINGNVIYTGIPERLFSKVYKPSELGLVEGSNHITFLMDNEGSCTLDDVRLTIIHRIKGHKSITKMFTVDDEDYQKLREGYDGVVKFMINKVETPGVLKIKIKDPNGVEHDIFFQRFSIGWNEVHFSYRDVGVGTNYLMIESPDGTFHISGLQIKI